MGTGAHRLTRQENEFMIKWLKGEHIKIKV